MKYYFSLQLFKPSAAKQNAGQKTGRKTPVQRVQILFI